MPKIPGLPFVRSGVSEGLSANEAFRRYQQAAETASEETGQNWTAGNRSVFLQQFGAIASARGGVPEAISSPKDQPSGGLAPTVREATRPGGYLNWVVAFTRPIGSSDLERTFHPIRSNEPLTPQEAEDMVRADIEASETEAHGTFYRYTIEGLTWTGTEELVPLGGHRRG